MWTGADREASELVSLTAEKFFQQAMFSACFRRRFMRAKRDRTISDVLPFGRLRYSEPRGFPIHG